MTYTKFYPSWQDLPSMTTAITAAALDHIEDGIVGAATAAIDEPIFYVSRGSLASDDNSGTSPQAPFATAAAAVAARGVNPGIILLLPGDHDSAADVLLTQGIGQHLHGFGLGLTQVNIVGDGDWAAKIQHTFCSIKDILFDVPGVVTYGVGASTPTDTDSIHEAEFTSVWVKPSGTMTAAFALGPDWPGSSAVDLAGTKFDHCTAYADDTGHYTHGFLIGNGTSGNVAQNRADTCQVVRAQFGVTLAGGGFGWTGGGMGYVTEADFNVTHEFGDLFVVSNVRSEVGAMVLKHGYVGTGIGAIHFTDYNALGYDPPDNETIINCATHLHLTGGSYRVVGGDAKVVVDEFGGGGRIFGSNGVAFDSDDPYRGISSSVARTTSGTLKDVGGIAVANLVADSVSTPWTAFTPTISGTGWALGNAFTLGRTKTVQGVTFVEYTITFGLTSAYGAGQLFVNWPAAGLPSGNIGTASVKVNVTDSGTNTWNLNGNPTLTGVQLFAVGASGAWGAAVTASVPITFSSGDTLCISASFEAP